MDVVEILILLLMAVGVLGIVIPVLPGLLIILGGTLIWALVEQSRLGWWLFAIAAVIYLVGVILQWAIPGKRMKMAGVQNSTLLIGVVVALAMGFVIPVVGLFLGFPLGIFLVSLARTRDGSEAVRATKHALRAVGTNILIELITAFTIISAYVVTVVFLDRA